jgi:hypothetical protein
MPPFNARERRQCRRRELILMLAASFEAKKARVFSNNLRIANSQRNTFRSDP